MKDPELAALAGEFDDVCPIDDAQDALALVMLSSENSDVELVAVLGYN